MSHRPHDNPAQSREITATGHVINFSYPSELRAEDQLVADLYWALARSVPKAPETQDSDYRGGEYPALSPRFRTVPALIPARDGWYYHPHFAAPEPTARRGARSSVSGSGALRDSVTAIDMTDKRAGELKRRAAPLILNDEFIINDDERHIYGLELLGARIAERARKHRLLNHAQKILSFALDEARADLREAEEEADRLIVIYSPPLTPAHRQRQEFLYDLIPWLRLRVYFLEEWERLEQAKRDEFDADMVKVREGNFTGLIKPAEVYQAYHYLSKVFGDEASEETLDLIDRILGIWYAVTLWQCGAGWRDLRRIRRTRKVRLKDLPKSAPRLVRERELGRERRETPFYGRWSTLAKRRVDDADLTRSKRQAKVKAAKDRRDRS